MKHKQIIFEFTKIYDINKLFNLFMQLIIHTHTPCNDDLNF